MDNQSSNQNVGQYQPSHSRTPLVTTRTGIRSGVTRSTSNIDPDYARMAHWVHQRQTDILNEMNVSSLFNTTADFLQLELIAELKRRCPYPPCIDYIEGDFVLKGLSDRWGIANIAEHSLVDDLLTWGFPKTGYMASSHSPVISICSYDDDYEGQRLGGYASVIVSLGEFIGKTAQTRISMPWGQMQIEEIEECDAYFSQHYTHLASSFPPRLIAILPALQWAYDKIRSEPRDRVSRLFTLEKRLTDLERGLHKRFRIDPQQFDREPDSADIVAATNSLKGAIAYLSYDYALFVGRAPELEQYGEGYVGYMAMRKTVNSLQAQLRGLIQSESGQAYLAPRLAAQAKELEKSGLASMANNSMGALLIKEAKKVADEYPSILNANSEIEIHSRYRDVGSARIRVIKEKMSISDMLMKKVPSGDWYCAKNCKAKGKISNSDRDNIRSTVTQTRYDMDTEIPFQFQLQLEEKSAELNLLLETAFKAHTQNFLYSDEVPKNQKTLLESFLAGHTQAHKCAYDEHTLYASVFIPYDANNNQTTAGEMVEKDGLLYSPYKGFTWIQSHNYSLSSVQQEAISSCLTPSGKRAFERRINTKFVVDIGTGLKFPVDPLQHLETQVGGESFSPVNLSIYLKNSMSEYFDEVFDERHFSLQESWDEVQNNLKQIIGILSLIAIPIPQLSLALIAGNIAVSIVTLTDPESSRSDRAWAIVDIGLEALGAIGDVIVLSKHASRALMGTMKQAGADSLDFKRCLTNLAQTEVTKTKGGHHKLLGFMHHSKKAEIPVSQFKADPSIGQFKRIETTPFEQAKIDEISSQITSISDVKYYIQHPNENCENAAKSIFSALSRNTDVDNIQIGNIAMWDEFIGRSADMFDNHWVIFARYQGVEMASDPTAAQFAKYGIQTPIFDTRNNWIAEYQRALGGYKNKKVLAKMVYPDNFGSKAPYRSNAFLSPFDPVTTGDTKVLSQSRWYTEEGFKVNLKSQQTRVTKGGPNGFSWPKLSVRKPDSQSLKSFTTPSGNTASVVRNKVGSDFMLYTANDGVQADTLLISVHGGHHQSASLTSLAFKTGDIKVPDGVTMEFLGPHGRTLSDPSIEIMNNPHFSPHSTVTSSGHTFNPHKTTGSTHMFQRDVVDASGSSDVGNIKDYRIFKYQGRHSGGAETEANIVDAIINNRQGTTRATDVLTVRERTFAFSEASLSDVFQQLDLKNSQYKYVTFSGCRNELSAANPPNYSNKSGRPMWITVDVSGDIPRVVYAKPIAELLQWGEKQGDRLDFSPSDE
ncbi:putative adhesin [Vibrio hepatarius]|uniref:putative adhesin n=1 Tax=Vibrio hepatarius TaxID=171383 RepID=UPI001C09A3F2|nr:hypothetical protein [Vibrio hepatarius]MBU2897827.1 hypothetical protein [Vibrio hepatarius]